MRRTTLFKQYLQAPDILMIPVAHDPLGAKILQGTGFRAVGCTGPVNAAAMLGGPDLGILTLDEMADTIWRMADAVDIPVWAGSGDGYADAFSVQRTVRLFEKAGAASLMFGDRIGPDDCDHGMGSFVLRRRSCGQNQGGGRCADRWRFHHPGAHRRDCRAWPGERHRTRRAVPGGRCRLGLPRCAGKRRAIAADPAIADGTHAGQDEPGRPHAGAAGGGAAGHGYAAVLWPNAFTLAYAKLSCRSCRRADAQRHDSGLSRSDGRT